MVKVSVVIASFNCEEFICDAIESVLNQTFKDYEIIVVDDGSIDNTKNVLEPYILKGEVKYFYQPNGGPSSCKKFWNFKSIRRIYFNT